MPAHPIEIYLTALAEIRGTRSNVPETSFYPALEQLLNEIGKTLSPRVRCVIHVANTGAGLPDAGLFTADQFRRQARAADEPDNLFLVQNPSRGVIEAKSPKCDLDAIVGTEQVERYWKKYGVVLVTNFRAFALVGKGPTGQPRVLESFELAPSEAAFWALTAHPRKAADEQGERMLEYLKRVLLHNAPLAAPQDVAAILASYAHDARLRVERADIPALHALRQALEESLGLRFEGDKGEHFFRSTLVQTLFYGVFSAWVLWSRQRAAGSKSEGAMRLEAASTTFAAAMREAPATYAVAGAFDWRSAHYLLRVPMLRALFVQVADPARLGSLGLIEVLDWAAAALNRVDRAAFFTSFDEGHAVQYFYEPFLDAFDPALRKELGVWYTPEELVRYQVERVDAVLRSELGLADGLADPQVVVLDPCCGTGAYLRAVLRRIAVTLREKGGDALVANDLKHAAMERVFGFEILPAPFVIAHLQLGLELETLGAPLSDRTDPPQRVGVYLTNALTGWEPPKEPKTQLLFPEMAAERDAADHVKQGRRILVILGNPPYNGYAGVAFDEERDLSNAYRTTRRAPAPQGQGLNDLYIRFFRMAERRITEMNQPAQGVICFISNYSWLDGLSFTGMRERYLEGFDRIQIDCLNGDKYKTGKLTPEGNPDPSAFSTDSNREGIQVGTAIALLVKKSGSGVPPLRIDQPTNAAGRRVYVLFRHFWGKNKRIDLLADTGAYQELSPAVEMGFPFLPGQVATGYVAWPMLPDLFPSSFPGVKTSRDDFLVDTDRDRLLARLRAYFDPAVSHDEMRQLNPGVMEDTARFKGESVRDTLRKRGFLPDNVVRYCYRPFDVRWLYWEPETKLLDEKRSEYFPHVFEGNVWIEARQRQLKEDFDRGYFVRTLADNFGSGLSNFFPLFLHSDGTSLLEPAGKRSNLSETATAYLADLKAAPEELFYHALAVLHAPAYRAENAGGLRQDWPRIPLPTVVDAASSRVSRAGGTRLEAASTLTMKADVPTVVDAASSRMAATLLRRSAALGRQVAALLDPETPVPGVTTGKIRDELKRVAVFERLDGKSANPDAGDLDLTAGWGHAGKGGVCMPGRGKVVVVDAAYDHSAGVDAASSRVSCAKDMRLEAASTTIDGGALPHYFDPQEPIADLSGNLPHWRQQGCTYFVTFRTADSMPQAKLKQWSQEREAWLASHPEPHDAATRAEYYERFQARFQNWLDAGYGKCLLARSELRDVVDAALRHFDTERYLLHDYVVMPNHVHALVTPLGEHTLSEILHSWKSFTANEINARSGGSGSFWQKETFDHILRGPAYMERFREYIRANRAALLAGCMRLEAASTLSTKADAVSPTIVDAASSRASCADAMRLEAASTTTAYDVYLNDVACWRNVPEPVWEYTIGGYQVIKKWLSYREKPLLGRGLTPAEVRHVTDTARRLAALIAMQIELDQNYRKVAGQILK